MIVSHEHGFVFVKTIKTASTSIEIALSRACGERDIITAISPKDERIRAQLGYRGPQNDGLPLRGLTPSLIRQGIRERQWPKYYNHIPARRIRQAIGHGLWDEYTTFTIERNPWDRSVSRYFWATRGDPDPPSFSHFLRACRFLSNFPIYSIHGRVAVDHVMRYEELEKDFERIWSDVIDVSPDPALPHAKSGIRPTNTKDYREMYDDGDREFVRRHCASEIELLGYRFE